MLLSKKRAHTSSAYMSHLLQIWCRLIQLARAARPYKRLYVQTPHELRYTRIQEIRAA